jgi:flavin-dependent dehydrogenase
MSAKIFDIAIIGGGPAGSTAAIYLSSFGFDVCLIEKQVFPREVLCGEFLSYEVTRNLKNLDLYEDFLTLNPVRINSFLYSDGFGSNFEAPIEFPSYALKRSAFDFFLLNNAAQNVTVLQPCEVKQIEREKNNFKLYIRKKHLNHGNMLEDDNSIFANHVIGAYGKKNILDASLKRNFTNYKSCLSGIKFHADKKLFRNLNENQISIFSSGGIYCGINPVNDDEITVCFLEDRRNYQGSTFGHLSDLLIGNNLSNEFTTTALTDRLSSYPVCGMGNIYFGRRNLIENGIFMIGDAAGIIMPLTGDGISMAMESARLLSELFFEYKKMNKENFWIEESYRKIWEDNFSRRLKTARLIQNVILHDFSRYISNKFLKLFPGILSHLIYLTRN